MNEVSDVYKLFGSIGKKHNQKLKEKMEEKIKKKGTRVEDMTVMEVITMFAEEVVDASEF